MQSTSCTCLKVAESSTGLCARSPTNGIEFDFIDQFARTVLTTLPSLLAQLLLRGFLGRVSSEARTE